MRSSFEEAATSAPTCLCFLWVTVEESVAVPAISGISVLITATGIPSADGRVGICWEGEHIILAHYLHTVQTEDSINVFTSSLCLYHPKEAPEEMSRN